MEKVYNFILNIIILIILVLSFKFVTYKYTKDLSNENCISSFNRKWKNAIHSLYSKIYFDEENELLNTNYELNNGLFIDLQNKLKIPKI